MGSNGPRRGDGPSDPDPRRRDLAERLAKLDRRLDAHAPPEPPPAAPGQGGHSGIGQALRMSSEFVAAVAVGAGLGFFGDRLLGTSPWGLVVLLLLGFAAGVLNILRSVGAVAPPRRGDGSH